MLSNECGILCRNWNLILDPDLDTQNYVQLNNPKARNEELVLKSELDLVDIWRNQNELMQSFTWRQKTHRKQATLDFFLISESLASRVNYSEILPGYTTDHSGILLKLSLQDYERSKGYWKLNSFY